MFKERCAGCFTITRGREEKEKKSLRVQNACNCRPFGNKVLLCEVSYIKQRQAIEGGSYLDMNHWERGTEVMDSSKKNKCSMHCFIFVQ